MKKFWIRIPISGCKNTNFVTKLHTSFTVTQIKSDKYLPEKSSHDFVQIKIYKKSQIEGV